MSGCDCTLHHGTPAQRMVAEQLLPHGVTDERVLLADVRDPARRVPVAEVCAVTLTKTRAIHRLRQTSRSRWWSRLMTRRWRRTRGDGLEGRRRVGLPGGGAQPEVPPGHHTGARPALAEHASERLSRLGFTNVEVAVADGSLGCRRMPLTNHPGRLRGARGAPAAARQLKDGGRMVIPVVVSPDQPAGPSPLREARRRRQLSVPVPGPVVPLPQRLSASGRGRAGAW